jgi:hypothetical protein
MLSLVVYGMLRYLILCLSRSEHLAGYLAGAIWPLAVSASLAALRRLFPTCVLATTGSDGALATSVRWSIVNRDRSVLLRLPPLRAYTIASICGDFGQGSIQARRASEGG